MCKLWMNQLLHIYQGVHITYSTVLCYLWWGTLESALEPRSYGYSKWFKRLVSVFKNTKRWKDIDIIEWNRRVLYILTLVWVLRTLNAGLNMPFQSFFAEKMKKRKQKNWTKFTLHPDAGQRFYWQKKFQR